MELGKAGMIERRRRKRGWHSWKTERLDRAMVGREGSTQQQGTGEGERYKKIRKNGRGKGQRIRDYKRKEKGDKGERRGGARCLKGVNTPRGQGENQAPDAFSETPAPC